MTTNKMVNWMNNSNELVKQNDAEDRTDIDPQEAFDNLSLDDRMEYIAQFSDEDLETFS